MSTIQVRLRDFAREHPGLKRVLVTINDTFIDRSVPASYKVMRAVCRFDTLRRIVLAGRREQMETGQFESALVSAADPHAIRRDLRAHGYALGLQVDDSVRRAVSLYCASNLSVTDKGERVMVPDGETPPLPARFIYRYPDLHHGCPSVAALAKDPLVLGVVKEYLQSQNPLLLGTSAWYSYPPPSTVQGQPHEYGFHYDIDDYKFVKLFIYLSDVDEDCGPHVIVGGTHGRKSLFEKVNRRISDDVAKERYGSRIRVITGPAGTAFFEDTFCYHKGTAPQRRRFLLQIEYGLTEFPHRRTAPAKGRNEPK